MEDLIVQIQSLPVKPEDIVLVTFSNAYDLEELNECLKYLEQKCPELRIIGNIEGMIKNITVLDMPVPYTYEGVSKRAW